MTATRILAGELGARALWRRFGRCQPPTGGVGTGFTSSTSPAYNVNGLASSRKVDLLDWSPSAM